MVGIIGYGAYIPKYRIKLEEIAKVWGKNPQEVISSLGVAEKSVAGIDEDAVTMAVEAGQTALRMGGVSPSKIGSILVGSETHPYAVNPSSTIIGETLACGNNYLACDLEFACKAATTGIWLTTGLIESQKIDYGLVIGSDCAQAKPHDVLEYTAGSAATAFILGNKKNEVMAEILDFATFSSDTPDFWRRDGIRYPAHAGRFTGKPGYFAHVIGAAKKLFQKSGTEPSDFDYCVFHMPNGKFPKRVAKILGFSSNQLESSLIVEKIGNPYSASSLLGLCQVLDQAQPEAKIFFVSYGSGAGADGFIFQTTKNLMKKRRLAKKVAEFIKNKSYLSYAQYLKIRRKI